MYRAQNFFFKRKKKEKLNYYKNKTRTCEYNSALPKKKNKTRTCEYNSALPKNEVEMKRTSLMFPNGDYLLIHIRTCNTFQKIAWLH